MKKLLNTLYVMTPNSYLAQDGGNVVVKVESEERFRIPFLNLESIVCFGYSGASPSLMGACAENGIGLSFLTENGRFLARVSGRTRGNVLVRRRQYRIFDSPDEALKIARISIAGKIANSRKIVERAIREKAGDKPEDNLRLRRVSADLDNLKKSAFFADNIDSLRGLEGMASNAYFSVLDKMILREESEFRFTGRNRRPPKDRINALLSFGYTLLYHDVQSALESVGLDPYVGYFHRDRPGRAGLALDVMEEFRAYLVDKFVIAYVNLGRVGVDDFIDNGVNGVELKDRPRREFVSAWQERKKTEIIHPFLGEKVRIGLLPYIQATFLNKMMREELEKYPVFISQ